MKCNWPNGVKRIAERGERAPTNIVTLLLKNMAPYLQFVALNEDGGLLVHAYSEDLETKGAHAF